VLVTSPPPVSTAIPGSVETMIVKTVAVAQTQTLLLVNVSPTKPPTLTPLPTKTASITPSPTATVLFVKPSNTPAYLPEDEDNAGTTGGEYTRGGFLKEPKEWDCQLLSKSPASNTVVPRDTNYRITWTVKNTGTKTWPKKGVDIVYVSGADLLLGKPYFDIPATVVPGGTVTFTITLAIPKYRGTYSTRFGLRVGKTDFCSVKFTFDVQ